MAPTIFLDIDGVLNDESTDVKIVQQDDQYLMEIPQVERLNGLVERTGANIVLTSDWGYYKTHSEIAAIMEKFGFKFPERVLGLTPKKFSSSREMEIWMWLDIEGHWTDNLVVLEDFHRMYEFHEFTVYTDTSVGLTDNDCMLAEQILSRPFGTIWANEGRMGGTPCIRGSRVTVSNLMESCKKQTPEDFAEENGISPSLCRRAYEQALREEQQNERK